MDGNIAGDAGVPSAGGCGSSRAVPQPAAAPVPKSPADASPAAPGAAPSAKRETPTGSKPIQGEVIDVPNGTPDELLQFIGRLLRTRPAGQDRPQKIANFMEMQRAIVKAASNTPPTSSQT